MVNVSHGPWFPPVAAICRPLATVPPFAMKVSANRCMLAHRALASCCVCSDCASLWVAPRCWYTCRLTFCQGEPPVQGIDTHRSRWSFRQEFTLAIAMSMPRSEVMSSFSVRRSTWQPIVHGLPWSFTRPRRLCSPQQYSIRSLLGGFPLESPFRLQADTAGQVTFTPVAGPPVVLAAGIVGSLSPVAGPPVGLLPPVPGAPAGVAVSLCSPVAGPPAERVGEYRLAIVGLPFSVLDGFLRLVSIFTPFAPIWCERAPPPGFEGNPPAWIRRWYSL